MVTGMPKTIQMYTLERAAVLIVMLGPWRTGPHNTAPHGSKTNCDVLVPPSVLILKIQRTLSLSPALNVSFLRSVAFV